MVTLHGLKGFEMDTGSPWQTVQHPIDRDTLLLPEVLVEDFSVSTDNLLRPVFDALWQAAGFSSCEHYDAQGHYDGGLSKLRGGIN
jgi:hypothetical protein